MNTVASPSLPRRALLPTRNIVHISMLGFAFLLPFLTWPQAAGAALLALLFNAFILPRLQVDLSKPAAAGSTWTGIVIYPISVLFLILVFRHEMYIAAAAWAIMALGDSLASVAGEALGGPTLPYHPEKTWTGSAGFVVAGTAGAYVLTRWVGPSLPRGQVLAVVLASAVVGALVEGVPQRLDDNLSVPLVSAGFMFCAYLVERSAVASNLPYLGRRVVLAAVVNLAFALAAVRLKTIDRSGAVAGFILGVVIYLAWGWKSFALLLAFFAIGSLATRLGYESKRARGVAEKRGGARGWREALANGLAPAFFAALVLTTHHEAAFLLALVAALAEAAGDTVASEIGEWLSRQAYLITTFQPVEAGENGGVSLPGTAAGLVAAAAIVALGWALGLVRGGPSSAVAALVAAIAGNLLDSVLGATLERRHLVSNGIVNFASTAFAGAVAFVLSH